MKYIHDGEHFVAWTFSTMQAHVEMAAMARMRPVHAGFLRFGDSQKDMEVLGRSTTLGLQSEPFSWPETEQLYVAGSVDPSGPFLIGNHQLQMQRLSKSFRVELREAQWMWSPYHERHGVAWHPGHPEVPRSKFELNYGS
jgi:hypothetical protein